MKTLIITLEYPPQIGGIASFVYNLASHLPPEQTVVWAPSIINGQGFDAKNLWKTYRGTPYYSFFWPRWLKLYWQIKKIIKQEGIQQIYVQHALPVGYVAKMIKRMFKIPYTIFFHGTDVELGTKFKKNKLENVCLSADTIIMNSQSLAKKLAERLRKLDLNKIKVVNPCPADFFFTRCPAEEINKLKSELALNGRKVILTVARLDEGKGYPHLLHLLPEVLNKVSNAVLVIIGDGPKRKQILEQIQKENLQNSVRFLGDIPYQNLPAYFQLADIFVLLTHKDEGREESWGTAFLEAAASGLPVVAGKAGGIEEVVENLKTGIIVDVYQPQGIISTIIDLLHQPDFARQMGAAGQKRVQEQFTWDQQLKKLI